MPRLIDSSESPLSSPLTPDPSTRSKVFRDLRAPVKSLGTMVRPPLEDAELLLKGNLALPWSQGDSSTAIDLDWNELQSTARAQLIADATRYSRSYRDVDLPSPPSSAGDAVSGLASVSGRPPDPNPSLPPIIIGGHQPALFHPGVWFKNFGLHTIAQQCGGVPVNLVIDNDACTSTSVRAPVVDDLGRAGRRSVPYDRHAGGVPYEQTSIQDAELFDSFDQRLTSAIRPLVADPLIGQLWSHAREARRRCGIAGCALAQARHALEGEMGWQTLELPLGVAVRGQPFARFVVAILDEIERFADVYNDSTNEYRRWHKIRSSAHPVPNLSRDDSWIETPLWLYGNQDPQRRGVWVRRCGKQLELSDRHERTIRIDATDLGRAADQLADQASPEFKLRPRALMTTMFARLVLSDLFLHGIGGGKYDQLADQIIRRFFEITPPMFQVISGTVRLPGIDVHPERLETMAKLKRLIRETRFQGERHLRDEPMSRAWIQTKQTLLANQPESGQRSHWHRKISEVNDRMSARLSDQRRVWQSERAQLEFELLNEQVLASREHSFTMYPLEFLRNAFERMIQPSP